MLSASELSSLKLAIMIIQQVINDHSHEINLSDIGLSNEAVHDIEMLTKHLSSSS